MWERLTAPEDVFSKLQRDNLAIFESYWTPLMEVVCRDACDGREISRVRRCYASFSAVLCSVVQNSLFLNVFLLCFRCWHWHC